MPDLVVFYLEGPAPGVDLLIRSVVITCSTPSESEVFFFLPNFTSTSRLLVETLKTWIWKVLNLGQFQKEDISI